MNSVDQTILNWVLSLSGVALGAIVATLWGAIKDLQTADKQLIDRVAAIEVLVAGTYVKRDELTQLTQAMFSKLDRIEDKLDKKVDKVGSDNTGGRHV